MRRTSGLAGGVVGYLVFVEFTSGVLQGYYTPLLSDIARNLSINDADINWFEAAQLMLSAIVVPSWPSSATCTGTGACCSCRWR
jgi:hypothetical protein